MRPKQEGPPPRGLKSTDIRPHWKSSLIEELWLGAGQSLPEEVWRHRVDTNSEPSAFTVFCLIPTGQAPIEGCSLQRQRPSGGFLLRNAMEGAQPPD